jgi:predicted enzyme related to lactoylglutathione lyase
METPPGTIAHLEIPASDVEKLAAFHRQLFGWKVEKTTGPIDYWMGKTTLQGINGGI